MKPRISAAVITLNEEADIAACLESLSFADEIVVLDSGSSDATVSIARRYTERVLVEEWRGFVGQKNRAHELCTGDWVFSLDADERVGPELRSELLARFDAAHAQPLPDGFSVPRRSFYLGRWIGHGGWWPDRKVRLARRDRALWSGADLHERLTVRGGVEKLAHPILHIPYRDIEDHVTKMNSYTTLAARERFRQGKRAHLTDLTLRPAWRFFSRYILKLGFLDGHAGFVAAAMGSWYVFLRYAKLREMEIDARAGKGDQP